MKVNDHEENNRLALYVAGVLPESEMIAITKEVNENILIRTEVEQLEKAFMAYSSLHAPDISPKLESIILNIGKQGSIPKSKVNNKGNNRSLMICALGWLLFAASFAYNVYQKQQQKSDAQTIENSIEQQRIFAQDHETLIDKYELTKSQFAEIRQADTKSIILESVGKVPNAEATVFWNKTSQNVYVDIASLPAPPEGKVYQLWRMISLDPLTPNDAGVLDGYSDNDQKLFVGKKTDEALAFAITLEPEGGSKTPTLEELYVLGKV